MSRIKRIISKNSEKIHSNGRTTLFGILTLATILIGLLLYLTNERQNEQVLNSYCSDFGFGGKSITLMKDGTFTFNYSGCSQSNGYVSGDWKMNSCIMSFYPIEPDELLDSEYKLVGNKLVATNLKDAEFTLCEEYIDPWERLNSEEKDN